MKKMVKVLVFAVVAGLLFIYASCSTSSDGSGDEVPLSEKTFNAYNIENENWYTVDADLLAVGRYCLIYAEKSSGVTRTNAALVAAEYDAAINNKIITNFGNYEDIDKNGKITLLLLDIVDGYVSDGDAYVAGYFDATHMFPDTVYRRSNECDMIFVDIYPVKIKSEEFYTTIAHEFQHMINFSRTYMVDGREEDLWVNEGLSSGAEYVYSGEVSDERVWWFNNDPLDTIVMGNNFFVWNGYWENDYNSNCVLDNYATVNLFFQWLRIHASNGTAIYKEILNSTNRDYRAVTAAASNRIDSQFGAWDRLLETWYIANFRGQNTGWYGYKGALATDAIGLSHKDGDDYQIEAGEGIISAASTTGAAETYMPPDGSGDNIQYAGFDYADTDVDYGSSFYNEFILVMNANTDNTAGQFEDCFVANVVGGQGNNPVMQSIQARKAANIKAAPKGYNIGFHPGLNDSRETPEQKMLKGQGGKITPVKKSAARKGR